MFWGFLKALWQGLLAAIFDKVVEEAKKPSTAEEAVTPKSEKDKWNKYVENELKGKDPYIPGVDPPKP